MEKILILLAFMVSLKQLKSQTDTSINVSVSYEESASFPGGEAELYRFIQKNNKWHAGTDTITGKVFVGFTVEVDGGITGIEIIKGLSESCDKEAMRIIQLMPRWIPGESNGKPVKRKVVYPIWFGNR